MYQAFFGLREKPFNLTPDPKFLYLNSSYREALASLHYAIAERKGFATLVGEAGTGKTTLLRRLLSELPRDTRSVLVINPAVSFEELLRFILTDLGRPPTPGTTKLQMTEALNAELLDTLARGGNVVVLIDEAQDLTIPVLEELRLLSNLETAKEKILQFVLAGQPEFESMLSRPEIRQLRQRIAVNARLRPLGRREVKAYVAARIAAAGGDERGLFRPAALYRLWSFSGGVPRLVNVACDNALVTAYAAGKRTVGWKGMGEAVRDLLPGPRVGARRVGVPAVRFGTIAAAAVLGAGGAYAVSHLTAARDVESRPGGTVPAQVAPPAAASAPAAVAMPAGTQARELPRETAAQAAPDAVPEGGAAAVAAPRADDSRVAAQPPPRVDEDLYRAAPAVGMPSRPEPAPRAEPVADPMETGQGAVVEHAPSAGDTQPRHPAAVQADRAAPQAGEVFDRVAATTEPDQAQARPDLEPARGSDVRVVATDPSLETPPSAPPAALPAPARAPGEAAGAVRYVRVERGDTMTAIAHRHYGYLTAGLLDAIKRANPGLRDIDVISVGGTLVLPPAEQAVDRAQR